MGRFTRRGTEVIIGALRSTGGQALRGAADGPRLAPKRHNEVARLLLSLVPAETNIKLFCYRIWLTLEAGCFTIVQSNRSSTDGKGGLDDAGAKAVIELWFEFIGRCFLDFLWTGGQPATA